MAFAFAAGFASAATIVVDTAGDGASGCTLRRAVTNANDAGATFGACTAGSAGGNTIQFSAALNGTPILLTGGNGPVNVTRTLTVAGNGAANTIIDGAGATRIFDNNPGNGITFSVSDVTLRNGAALLAGVGGVVSGGAMWVAPGTTLSIANSVFSDNDAEGSGGAIYVAGTTASVMITNSTFSGNIALGEGGAIRNIGTLTISGSTFSTNQANAGGAIYNSTPSGTSASIANSTFHGNVAAAYGGAVMNDPNLASGGGNIDLAHVTLASNTASSGSGGALYNGRYGGAAALSGATQTLAHSLLAANTAGSGSNCGTGAGSIVVSQDYNVFQSTTGCSIGGAITHNVTSASAANLGTLASRGGPTQTMSLSAGNPAIDFAPTCVGGVTTDQRGVTRPVGAGCDAGAFEAPLAITLAPTSVPGANYQAAYNQAITASGGTGAFTYAVTAGATPPGITLSGAGLLSGAATSAGTFNFTVTATDSAIPTAATGSRAYSIVIAAVVPGAPTIGTATTSASGSASVTYSAPASNGGSTITSYTATSDPEGRTATGLSNPLTVTGLTNGVSYTFTVRATNSAGSSLLSAASNAVVPKAPQTISFANPGSQVFGTSPTLTATAGSTLAVTFSSSTTAVCTITGTGTLTFLTVGGCTILADQAGDGAFHPAPQASQSFTVTQATQSISFAGLGTKTLGDAPFPVSATGGASGNPVTFSSSTTAVCTTGGTNGSTVTIVGAGTCTINADQAASTNYSAAAQVPQSFTVNKAAQSITFNALGTKAVGDAAFAVNATGGASGSPVTFASTTTAVCTTGGTHGATVTIVAVGTCTIAADQAGNTNYNPATQVTQSFTVSPGTQVITFAPLVDRALGSAPFTVSATGGASGSPVTFSSTTAAVCTTSGTNGTSVSLLTTGLCTIAADQAGNANYNAASRVTQSFTVQPTAQVITFAPLSGRTLGAAPFTVSATGGASGNPVTFSSTTPAVCTTGGTNGATVTLIAAGTCSITANQAGNGSHAPADPVVNPFQVAKGPQVITFAAPAARTFGTAPFALSATGGASNNPVTFASTTTAVCTTGGANGATVTLVAVGTCTIAADQAGSTNYDAAPQLSRSFAVNKAAQAITFAALGDRSLGSGTFIVAATGGASGNPVTFQSTTPPVCTTGGANGATVTLVAVGTCTLVASQASNANYDAAAPESRSFTVLAAGALTANPTSIAFGGQAVHTTTPAQPVTLTNTGGSTVTVTSVVASAGFTATHNCATLAPSATCVAQVVFAPTTIAVITGSLTVTSDASGSPTLVALGGTGEQSLINHYYRSILGREPDSGGLAHWNSVAASLSAIGGSQQDLWFAVAGTFFASAEYAGRARDDTQFVTDNYRAFFNRAPDSGGLLHWRDQLTRGLPRDAMIASFMFSLESVNFMSNFFGPTIDRSETDMLKDFYRGILGALPDEGGYRYWLGRLRAAQCQGAAAVYTEVNVISAAFLNSGQYLGRNRTDQQYVADLYNAFMRRGADLGGIQHWTLELTSGRQTRETLRNAFRSSSEFITRTNRVVSEPCIP